jgi:hypothetical protein
MPDVIRLVRATGLALAAALLALPAMAQGTTDADLREIQSYSLSEPGLQKYVQATRNLSALRIEDCEEDTETRSLAAAAAKLDATPGAKAAVESAGLTTREYLVFALALLQSGMGAWALDQPDGKLPPGVSMANVEFYRKHAGEIEKIAEGLDGPDCEEPAEDAG